MTQVDEAQTLAIEATVSYHNLAALADEVRREYFPRHPVLPVIWGKRPPRKRRRSIRLGSYDRATNMIRIHPLLNSPGVPPFFVQSIIHHEYLHHVLGGPHNSRFKRHERSFRFHYEAREWLKHNLAHLLGLKKRAAVRPRRLEMPRIMPLPPSEQLTLF